MLNPLPPILHSLRALQRILDKADSHVAHRKIQPAAILGDRLFPDMLPFTRQVQLATEHAKNIGARLAGIDAPKFDDEAPDFAALEARIEAVIDFLSAIPEEAFNGAEDRPLTIKAGPTELNFTGAQYLDYFAVPNFYFHMATAYNILRHNGVEVGKLDFLGGSAG